VDREHDERGQDRRYDARDLREPRRGAPTTTDSVGSRSSAGAEMTIPTIPTYSEMRNRNPPYASFRS